ncbi:hypothetical protein [Christiangramia sp. SM2212]|uniref:Lipoprotein n=1 Tax=Christiangramia sediminicola TaxID=3073267 RepID=A0ABU1EL36_9FLAO|nr:hypothetical protein [Christiangramia sp. SM2212]MDR5589096.1 hypothetical protein [Christiangramia sp. SM2212]
MNKIYFSLFKICSLIICFITSSCCNEDLTAAYKLSENAKSIVPFIDYKELNYINELGQSSIASTQPRILETKTEKPGPDSCQYYEYETLRNFINFENPGFSVQIEMSSNFGKEFFGLSYLEVENESSVESFNLENYTIAMDDFQQARKDTTIIDFQFNDVYIFSNEENRVIKTIVYSSSGRGIEFVEFVDGSFLKLE